MNKFKDPDKANSIFRAMFRYLAALYPYENEAGRGELSVFDQMDKEEGKLSDLKLLSQSIGYCDATYKKNIDVEAMEAPLREPAAKKWEEFHEKRAQLDGKSYADFMKDVPKPSVDEPFRKHYEKFPDEMKKWSDNNLGFFGGYNDLERIATLSKEDYVACMSAWSPYALLWEGKWYGKGDMGWWGISSNEENQWTGTFKELWAQIDGDEWVTVVDCHI
jgi:hypothetical protein